MRTNTAGSIASRVRRIFGARESIELARASAVRRKLRALLAGEPRDAPFTRLVELVDELRTRYGVEAVCAELPIAPADYYAIKARAADLRWRKLLAVRAVPLQDRAGDAACAGLA